MNNYNAAEGIITIDISIAWIRVVADAHLERNIISHTDKDFIHKFVCSLVLRVIRERERELDNDNNESEQKQNTITSLRVNNAVGKKQSSIQCLVFGNSNDSDRAYKTL